MATFEEQLTALELVVEKLERGDLPLDESVRLFEEGVTLSNAKNQGPFTGDSPIWRRRSWSEINQIQ